MAKRRVVVTGMGAITPLGNSVKDTWSATLEGKSGISLIEDFDTSNFATKFAGSIKGFNPEDFNITHKDAKKMDTFIQYGLAAALEALNNSGLEVTETNADRIGVCIGSGIGGLPLVEKNCLILDKLGPRRISPFFIPGAIINMIGGYLSINFGIKGPNIAMVTACTTGTHSIGNAARLIQYGDADVMLAGGSEKASSPLGIGGFIAARALSKRNDAPEKASRPWDKGRDGFVLSDGAAVVVLEEYEHAVNRNANILAEVIGYGMSADAYHITAPSEGGIGAATCMKNAIKDAGINASEIDYINAHATSTEVGDVGEVLAIKAAMGDLAYKIPVSSTKSMMGHLLGAAGAIEAIISVLTLRDQVIPPTINLDEPGEGCDLDFVPNTPRESNVKIVLSNSFGFGGTNGCLIFRTI